MTDDHSPSEPAPIESVGAANGASNKAVPAIAALAVAALLVVGGAIVLNRGSGDDATSGAGTAASNADGPGTVSAPAPATASAPTAAPATTFAPPATTSTTSSTTSTAPPTTTTPTTTSTTLPALPPLAFAVPIAPGINRGWGDGHGANYSAADIFADCGSTIVSPTNGVILEARTADMYDPAIDNPATRGGISIAIAGDDGVRYYLAHFEYLEGRLEPGLRVNAGTPLGAVGLTGRTGGCHVHFGLSPDCGGKEWKVRRGAIWPQPYLDAWAAGEMRSPRDEIAQWLAANPDACADALADPFAADS